MRPKTLYDSDDFTPILAGRYVTNIVDDTMILDDGTRLEFEGNMGCSCGNGYYGSGFTVQVTLPKQTPRDLIKSYIDMIESVRPSDIIFDASDVIRRTRTDLTHTEVNTELEKMCREGLLKQGADYGFAPCMFLYLYPREQL